MRRRFLFVHLWGRRNSPDARSCCGRQFTTGRAAEKDGFRPKFSPSSLGLFPSLVQPVLPSIVQLPEVEEGCQNFPSKKTVNCMRRASDIFSSFQPGGKEHLAVLAIQAEAQQRLAQYGEALEAINIMEHAKKASELPGFYKEDLQLAKAKILWTSGQFSEAADICNEIVEQYNDFEETFPGTHLHMASAMTGLALSRLAGMNVLADAYSVRDFFRIAHKFLERHASDVNPLSQLAAVNNEGCAEVIYALFVEEKNGVSVPIETALRTWFQGVQKLDTQISLSGDDVSTSIAQFIAANLQANLAWGVLNYEQDRKDYLKKASDYAGKAIASFDKQGPSGTKEGLTRILTVVADCYHKGDSAVTSQGLYQSAIDESKAIPGYLSMISKRDALDGYSKLCSQWEKREGEATKLANEAKNLDEALPEAWRGKHGLYSSFWFWTPGDFAQM